MACLSVWGAVIVLLAGTGAVRAEDAERARQFFQQGSKLYDVGQFDKAIEAWQHGYEEKPDPSFLFNIAQAFRQKEDPAKALFFYKSYLRNAPKAQNRTDVEQRIAALQKQLDSGGKATAPAGVGTTTPPPGAVSPLTPPAGPPSSAPPAAAPPVAVSSPPPTTLPSVTSPPPATDAMVGAPAASVTAGSESANGPADLAWDVSAAIGSDFWSSGVQGTADPSFAFTIGAGYRFDSASRLQFRLGGIFGYTFLNESVSKVTFLSFLADAALELRLDTAGRWLIAADLGLGGMSVIGLKPKSSLLDPPPSTLMWTVDGAQGLPLTRLGLAAQFRLRPDLTLFAGPSINTSPKKEHFHAAIGRLETTVGLAYRF